MQVPQATPVDCRWRIYVYELSSDWYDLPIEWHKSNGGLATEHVPVVFHQAFGERYGGSSNYTSCDFTDNIYDTAQRQLTQIIEYRLRTSACRTHDPAAANVFYIPMLPLAKKLSAYRRTYWKKPPYNTPGALTNLLPHLSTENAKRHFLVWPRVGEWLKVKKWIKSIQLTLTCVCRFMHLDLAYT
jgi:hypothetical protein